MGPTVALGTVASRQAGRRVWRPAALPERIHTEPDDEIRSTFGAVPAGANPGNEARSHVDAGGNGEAVPGLDACGSRKNRVETDFALEFLLIQLGTSGAGQCCRDSQRDHQHCFPGAHEGFQPRD
jgi:hypothetical protein